MDALGSAFSFTQTTTTTTNTTTPMEETSTPLQNSWCFWHYKPPGPNPTPEEYEAAIKILCSFSSIEGFWRCFNNLPTTDQLRIKWSFHMMKDGVRPLW